MPDLSVFGGCLRSALSFPELRSTAAPPTWTLEISDTEPSLAGAELLGEDVVDADIRVRAYRSDGSYVLDYDDTGIFLIADAGRTLSWWRGKDARDDYARLDVLGRVLPMALHAAGLITLHGSAVAVNGRAIAFLAPKYHGKSSLAFALVSAGAKLITDDALPVTLDTPALARPGVHCVRLFSDSASRLGIPDAMIESARGKVNMDELPDEQRMQTPSPLDAIYLIVPAPAQEGAPPIRRERVDSVTAALSLVRNAKLGPLLGRSEAPLLFERAVALARVVPVYALSVMRDLSRLDAAAGELMSWHATAAPDAISPAGISS
jgi:hypothetical protein